MLSHKSQQGSKSDVLKHLLNHSLSFNAVSFFLLSFIAFRANASYLFYGTDGRYEITLLTQNNLFVPLIFGYTNNFIQSLGNIWFAFNPRFIPEYFLSLSEDGVFTNFALTYAISALELFVATYFTARIAGVSRIAALCAAWLLPLLTYRYVQWSKIPSTFSSFPHYGTIAGLSAVLAISLLRLDHRRLYSSIGILSLFFVGISYIVVVAPTLIILVMPELGFFGLFSVLATRERVKWYSSSSHLLLSALYVFFLATFILCSAWSPTPPLISSKACRRDRARCKKFQCYSGVHFRPSS